MALIGSILLFVITSFAWFAVSEIVNIGGFNNQVKDINYDFELYVSTDGINYSLVEEIDFQLKMPGDMVYYRVDVTNNNNQSMTSRISLYGFNDLLSDVLGDDTNLLAGRSLVDVTILNAYNTVNTDIIEDSLIGDLIGSDAKATASLILNQSMIVEPNQTESLYFTLLFSGTAGNDYQNLALSIDHLIVQSSLV
jgi:hypothetical protein